ncbi:MAG: hypothetical protein LQ345_003862 [Seirophora villosa]|nr:MAG: hypothetical protein LQ345_003862 [Seirophora villosa]
MAVTRGANNITAPRAAYVPTSAPASRQTATKPKAKKTTPAKKPAATKANTSKPRAGRKPGAAAKDKTATGRVAKKAIAPKKAAAPKAKTVNKRDPSLVDKVQGVAEKIVGAIEGKPGKKVRFLPFALYTSPWIEGGSAKGHGGRVQAAGTKKIKGTDGKGATRAKRG